ncbi:MAG TPA: ATP-grasp domain-containing protein [Oligoflexus sp.]|uniref:ATP-grasp domain-containing protein n=1 Tax=Oligoflexus sp. TaxID=1971216 RepID=UPI002D564B11|nr:ATP-grasp domain-containing protein [Oligoflexus sp.]HYX38740.1 ATP-grasp domain-containing protein [Oligoflexus sp.]
MAKILMVGHRQGLIDAARDQGLDFLLWNGKELKNPLPARHLVKLPWPRTPGEWRVLQPKILALGPFSAIIGGSERSIPLVAALRRTCDLPSTAPINLLRCHDKLLMKNRLQAEGIPLNPYLWGVGLTADAIWDQLGPRIVCKDRLESGGRSIQIYSQKAELLRELHNRQRLFETYNPHPEFSVESFVEDGQPIFTNITQYYLRQHINILPVALAPTMQEQVLNMNSRVLQIMGVRRGMTHVELYLGPEGPVFGEIAVRPPGGYIMEMLQLAYGFPSWDSFLNLELGRSCLVPQTAHRVAAVHVLHPGRGIIQAIKGWPAVKHHASVHRAKLKVSVGDKLKIRAAVGEDVGYVLQTASTLEQLIPAVEDVRRLLQWTMDETA